MIGASAMLSKTSQLDKDFSDNDEPSLQSADPNERKLARRLRTQSRAEASQKPEAEDHGEAVKESLTEKQIIASEELLEKLIEEGNEVISNVRVANDARELERRIKSSEIRKQFLDSLDKNARLCKDQYDLINDQWMSILRSNDPLVIHEEMEWQRKKGEMVLAQKDAIIEDLKLELERIDREYFDDQAKQKDDIRLLIERIENQMSSMENYYTQELDLIKKMMKVDSDTLVESFRSKWDALYKQQEEEDDIGNERREKIMKEYEDQLEQVMRRHEEEYRAQKIGLEKECQAMEQQLEKTKAHCQLNTEKLTYNYTILKNREEENAIIKTQQKRKINRLQALLGDLRKNYADLQEKSKAETEKLSSDILKTHNKIVDMEDKLAQFSQVNEKKYFDVWDMNMETANNLVKKILEADESIHESILGILWDPPQNDLPRKEDLPSYRAAINYIQKKKQEDMDRYNICPYDKANKSPLEEKLEREVIHNILKKITKTSRFLVEDKLKKLISDFSDEEKTIISLDSIFDALSIASPQEMNVLVDVFMPYTFCSICIAAGNASSENLTKCSTPSDTCAKTCEGCKDEKIQKLIDSIKEEVEVNRQNMKISEGRSSSLDRSRSEVLGMEEYESKSESLSSRRSVTRKYTCDRGHVLDVHAAHVTKALKEVVKKLSIAEQKETLSLEERVKEKKYTISRNVSPEDVNYFWSCYQDIFGPHKEKLWDAILVGLNKYYEVLRERHKLCNEIDSLEKHNSELQRLLESHTKSIDDGLSALQIKSAKYSKC
ncbi:dynein regulatory complex protein 1 [Copidosoma floridanum]|uniref:dynein regulatory complex protein 1 n=1 Tax=Copidosoma floridanum TaxID=29053 RepID=UPI0006C94006|nr:dynein regulatory complex protein 1 [Copidosoma floridanum]